MTRPTCRGLLRVALALVLGAIPVAPLLAQDRYQNFDVAIYIVVNTTRDLADPATLERQYP